MNSDKEIKIFTISSVAQFVNLQMKGAFGDYQKVIFNWGRMFPKKCLVCPRKSSFIEIINDFNYDWMLLQLYEFYLVYQVELSSFEYWNYMTPKKTRLKLKSLNSAFNVTIRVNEVVYSVDPLIVFIYEMMEFKYLHGITSGFCIENDVNGTSMIYEVDSEENKLNNPLTKNNFQLNGKKLKGHSDVLQIYYEVVPMFDTAVQLPRIICDTTGVIPTLFPVQQINMENFAEFAKCLIGEKHIMYSSKEFKSTLEKMLSQTPMDIRQVNKICYFRPMRNHRWRETDQLKFNIINKSFEINGLWMEPNVIGLYVPYDCDPPMELIEPLGLDIVCESRGVKFQFASFNQLYNFYNGLRKMKLQPYLCIEQN